VNVSAMIASVLYLLVYPCYLRLVPTSADMEKHTVSRLVGAPPGYGKFQELKYNVLIVSDSV
jgi:hypothetical protein